MLTQHTARIAASRATRMPTLVDEKADANYSYQGVVIDRDIQSTGGLTAEKMTSYELGYLMESAQRDVSLDLRLFRDRLRNLITHLKLPAADFDGSVEDQRNEGSIDFTGAEVQLDWRPAPSTRFVLSYASMHADASGLSPDSNHDEVEHESSVPAFTWSVLAMHRFGRGWEGSLSYHRLAKIDWLGHGDELPSYGRLDVRLARAFRLDGCQGEIALVVQNVGNDFVYFDAENVFDRRSFISISLRH